jgi:hypothetical protein
MSWISVWTMLPPPDEPVLCRTHDGTAVVLKRLTNLVDGFAQWDLNGVSGYEVERDWEDAYERGGGVTHWMALPPSPDEPPVDDLPKLPEPYMITTVRDLNHTKMPLFTEDQMRAAVAAERQRAIDIVARHGGSVEIEAAIRGGE